MAKIITIDRCLECKHCAFYYRSNEDAGYVCTNGKIRDLDDVETIPEWCEYLRRPRMPTFELEFEVYCAKCGAGLCNQSDASSPSGYYNRTFKVMVQPCEKCLEEAKEEGYDNGYTDGQEEATDAG